MSNCSLNLPTLTYPPSCAVYAWKLPVATSYFWLCECECVCVVFFFYVRAEVESQDCQPILCCPPHAVDSLRLACVCVCVSHTHTHTHSHTHTVTFGCMCGGCCCRELLAACTRWCDDKLSNMHPPPPPPPPPPSPHSSSTTTHTHTHTHIFKLMINFPDLNDLVFRLW